MYKMNVSLTPYNDLIEILKRQQAMLDFSGIKKALTEYEKFRSNLLDLNTFNWNINKSFEPIFELTKNQKSNFSAIEEITNILSRYNNHFNLIENSSIISIVDQLQKIITLSNLEQLDVINNDRSNSNKEEIFELEMFEQEEVNLIVQETINDIRKQNSNIENRLMLWYEELKVKYPLRAGLMALVIVVILTHYITAFFNITPFSFNAKIRETPNGNSPIVVHISIENITIIETENINYYYKVEYIDENNSTRAGYVSKKNITDIKKSKKLYESREHDNSIETLRD